jgi:hypothetical protein
MKHDIIYVDLGDLTKELRVYAAKEGKSIKAIIESLVRQLLEQAKEK